MKTMISNSGDLVGSYRRFGREGPVYQVLKKVDSRMLSIVVVQTGETLNYPASKALQDPEAE
jgi:hypothetical protein